MRTDGITVLVLDSGGRGHALEKALTSSSRVNRVLVAPGNGGTIDQNRRAVKLDDVNGIVRLAQEEGVNLVIPGSEVSLVAGIADACGKVGISVFGPTRKAAQIEGSKIFSSLLCEKAHIPAPDFRIPKSYTEARKIIRDWGAPVVVKADGLCGGKGVRVCETTEEAERFSFDLMEKGVLGGAGRKIVFQKKLVGRECSVMAFCNEAGCMLLPVARDYKTLTREVGSPNTGGMGAYAPAPDVDGSLLRQIVTEIFLPTLKAMAADGAPYRGILYAGLMLTNEGPRVLEFNCRFGDPETQVVLPLFNSDPVEPMLACLNELGGPTPARAPLFRNNAAVCVVLASEGYPGTPIVGRPIRGLAEASRRAFVYHAGTKRTIDGYDTAGGRVLNIVGIGHDISEARERAYDAANCVSFEGMQIRRDIALGV